ncbi:MAG: formate dehydrogenase accessory sulfurtransferase FdhD [Deltaproteobacteria bacterium]|nr:formate dehydrogenase accessory sulfurtransferase FdhD [Deltaproteobacteria bacterium]
MRSIDDDEGCSEFRVTRFSSQPDVDCESRTAFSQTQDLVVNEAPLQLQVQGHDFAVLMRTPGHDEELGLGLLLAEGIITSMGDVRSVRHCERVLDPEAENNVLQVVLHEQVEFDESRFERNLFSSSSCGVCDKAAIEQLVQITEGNDPHHVNASATQICRAMVDLQNQPLFKASGGSHAAALFSLRSEEPKLLKVFEDVGRHNACDKIVGWALQEKKLPLDDTLLVLSSRIAFELVQKALMAKTPVVAALSAPTSLAVRLADEAGIVLLGFVREGRANIYTHASVLKKEA